MSNIYTPNQVELAAKLLQSGDVVGIPTETVYGLAADISNPVAVNKIFSIKNRPSNHPLIIHIATLDQLDIYARNIPDYAYKLAQQFWPGPLTLVLEKSDLVGDWVTGGQSTVGIRMPNHPLALSLLKAVGKPLAAPSANLFGRISPTLAHHVIGEFNGAIPVLDGGACSVGIESTIIDATHPATCSILRQGSITLKQIRQLLVNVNVQDSVNKTKRVSGSLKYHYAPSKPCVKFHNPLELQRIIDIYGDSIDILAMNKIPSCRAQNFVQMPLDSANYAQKLYEQMRVADQSLSRAIAIEAPPATMDWSAVNDRIDKATAKSNEALAGPILID